MKIGHLVEILLASCTVVVKKNAEFVVVSILHDRHELRSSWLLGIWRHHPELARRHEMFSDSVTICNNENAISSGFAVTGLQTVAVCYRL
jgi:hypothetical protein